MTDALSFFVGSLSYYSWHSNNFYDIIRGIHILAKIAHLELILS